MVGKITHKASKTASHLSSLDTKSSLILMRCGSMQFSRRRRM